MWQEKLEVLKKKLATHRYVLQSTVGDDPGRAEKKGVDQIIAGRAMQVKNDQRQKELCDKPATSQLILNTFLDALREDRKNTGVPSDSESGVI